MANYNLICLSSVIPAVSVIQRKRYRTPCDEYGYRLYVVMARQQADQIGRVACAGPGWTQERETGRGLFVEIHGGGRSQMEQDICATLGHMIASRPLRYGPTESEVVSIECQGRPVCALAMAVYESQGWN